MNSFENAVNKELEFYKERLVEQINRELYFIGPRQTRWPELVLFPRIKKLETLWKSRKWKVTQLKEWWSSRPEFLGGEGPYERW